MWDTKLKPRDTDRMVVTGGKGERVRGNKGAKYRVMEEDLTLGGGHTMRYTDLVSQNCTPETHINLSTGVAPMNVIKNTC